MIAIAKCGQRELSHRTSSPEDVEFTGEPLNQFVLSTLDTAGAYATLVRIGHRRMLQRLCISSQCDRD